MQIEVADGFFLYLVTRLAMPEFSPETSAKVTLVDFTVTELGLEEQLLGVLIMREKVMKCRVLVNLVQVCIFSRFVCLLAGGPGSCPCEASLWCGHIPKSNQTACWWSSVQTFKLNGILRLVWYISSMQLVINESHILLLPAGQLIRRHWADRCLVCNQNNWRGDYWEASNRIWYPDKNHRSMWRI